MLHSLTVLFYLIENNLKKIEMFHLNYFLYIY